LIIESKLEKQMKNILKKVSSLESRVEKLEAKKSQSI